MVDSSTTNTLARRVNRLIFTKKSFAATWIHSFFAIFLLCAVWSLATPLGAAPDEPAQIVKAAATVRGEITGHPAPGQAAATREFRVPAVFDSIYNLPVCYQFHPETPAGCAPHVRSSSRIVTVSSYVGRYPPLYYAVVGLPTLVMHSESVIYFMRLVGALVDALLLSLAMTIAAVWCRSTMLVGAIALTITPLVIFFAGVVNPSGLEIAAAICVWTSGLALVRERSSHPSAGLLTVVTVSGCLLELTRGLSVLWMVLILMTLVGLEPRACVNLLRRGSVRFGVAILSVVGVIAIIFVLAAHTLKVLPSSEFPPQDGSLVVVTEHVLGQMGGYLEQSVGVFGWLDTPSPLLTITLWTGFLGFLVVAGLVVSRRRECAVLAGLIAGSFIVTLTLIEWNSGSAGITWQARDGFPLYVGIPLLGGIVISRDSVFGLGAGTSRRFASILALAVGVSQLTDFVWTLRRYTVGLGHTTNLFRSVKGGWFPPLGTPLVVVLGTLAVTLYTLRLFILMISREPGYHPDLTGLSQQ